jgi:hypothetical protein
MSRDAALLFAIALTGVCSFFCGYGWGHTKGWAQAILTKTKGP